MQLGKLEGFIHARMEWAAFYDHAFRDIPEVEPAPQCVNGRHSWHLYILRLNTSKLCIDRDQFMVELKRKGIGGSVHFIPIPRLKFFSRWANLPQNYCPKAEELYLRSVSLPLYPGMTQEQVEYVADAVREIVSENRARVWAVTGS